MVNKPTAKIVFVIQDDKDFVWGIAPSKTQARRQIMWFLPKGLIYKIVPQIIPCNKESKNIA